MKAYLKMKREFLLLMWFVFISTSFAFASAELSFHQSVDTGSIDIRSRIPEDVLSRDIRCILCDMDGTFLRRDHSVSERNIDAVQRLKERGIRFFPATGRTRKSMLDTGGEKLKNVLGDDILKIPGVYSQGLIVYGQDGEIISEEFMDPEAIKLTEMFCDDLEMSLIGYSGERIVTRQRSYFTDQVVNYAEPVPDVLNAYLHEAHQNGIKINKLILLDHEEKLVRVRSQLEKFLHGKASVTRAVPGMLEVLPYQASKGRGVQKLLDYYDIHPDNCMAFGDGENDLEMIKLVKYGVAMGNAKEELKKAAALITHSNQDDGVAHVLEFFTSNV